MGAILRSGIRAGIAACAGLLMLTTTLPGVAIGDPGVGGLLADSPSLSLAAIGGDTDIALYGLQSTQTVTFPVPPGLTPAALNAVVELPPGVNTGSISVTQDNRTVSRIDLPPANQAPVSIPLAGAEVVGNAITMLLRGQLIPPQGYCLLDTAIPLRLNNATIAFTGREIAPRTVADFLPPILQKLTIFIPAAPSRVESDAAIRLTTAVVARYGKQQLDVEVAPIPGEPTAPTVPPGPFERQIVVREGPGGAVSLDNSVDVPTLSVTGSGNELANQIRLLTADLSRLAIASKAVAGPLRTSPQLPRDTTTIRDLGQDGVNATALKPQVSVALDQTRLGRPVQDVRVQLKGSYTPLPANVGGQVVASVGGQTVDRWPTDASGTIDRWVSVPDELLQRYTNLNVSVDITGDTGPCGRFQPVTLTIDGASTVQSSASSRPSPAGFQALPQALMPRTQIGIGADVFADTVRAATIMEGLQRLSALPLDSEVVPLQEATKSMSPALLISADGWNDDGIVLPVVARADSTLAVQRLANDGEPTTLALDPGQQLGSLQTVVDGDRTVLVATSNGAAAQLDSLLNWLDQDRMRWSQLRGTAVVAAPDREPVAVDSSPPRSVTLQPEPKDSRRWVWLGAGAAGVATALAAGLLMIRRRRQSGAS
jgi:hypothetical protein